MRERGPKPRLIGMIVGLFPFIWSCGMEATRTAGAFEVHDSAGVQIVVSHEPAWGAGEEWALDSSSLVVLGSEDGEEGLLWRVTGVTRLSDGRIAVLNAGSGEVRFFDSQGRYLDATGGIGGGPGEFQYPVAFIRSTGDTLVVLDRSGKRSFFSPQGELVKELPYHPGPRDPDRPVSFRFDAPLFDGTVLGRDRPLDASPGQGTGWFRPTVRVVRRDSDAELLAEFGSYGGIQQETLFLGERTSTIAPPFARNSSVALGGDDPKIVVGDNAHFELRVFDPSGHLEQVVRRSYEQPPVTAAEVEAWKDRQRSAPWVEGQLPELERGWAEMRVPETKPAFGMQFGITTDGYLWVAEYTDAPIKPEILHIFDPGGVYLGDLRIPAGLAYSPRAVEIGPDYFLGVFMDDLEVETVQLFRLIRGQE